MTFFPHPSYMLSDLLKDKHKALNDNPILWKLIRIGTIALIFLNISFRVFSAVPLKNQPIDQIKVAVEVNNESILTAFEKIEAPSRFHFIYRHPEDLKEIDNKIPGPAKPMAAFLKPLLLNSTVWYKQIDDPILIVKNQQAAHNNRGVINSSGFLQQQMVVKGQIKDAGGESLPAVSIKVKGTTTGTISDNDGRYSINVPDNATLVFTYIGFITKEVIVNNQSLINVILESETSKLNEVVVTALGIKRAVKSLTYSTQGVKTENLSEARELNVVNSLQGKVSGLAINQSANGVGSESRVVLRGNRSISGDSQPLYVVDGVPINGGITDISPDNIASINVLKGANAAALYGSKAQNGVIIIETKKGKAGVVNVSWNNNAILSTPIVFDVFQNEYGQGSGGNYIKSSETSWGPKMSGQMVNTWSANPADAGKQYAFTPQPSNVRDFFNNGYNISTSLSASAGGEKIQGAFSYTGTNATGVVPGNQLKRHNLALNLTLQPTAKLSVQSKISYMGQSIQDPIKDGLYDELYSLTALAYRLPRSISLESMNNYEYIDASGLTRQNYWNPGSPTHGGNLYYLSNRNNIINYQNRVLAMTSLTYNVSKGMSLMVRGGYNATHGDNETKLAADNYGFADYGRYIVSDNNVSGISGEFLGSYNKELGKNLKMNANLGAYIKRDKDNSSIASTGLAMTVPNFFTLSNTSQVVSSYSPGAPLEVQSVYAFGQIAWKDAIFLDITGRNDWSSSLPAANRSYFYPSVGVSAVLSELIPNISSVFSYAQLRASWARVGSGATPQMLQRLATFSAGGRNGFLQLDNILPNKNLKPEMTSSKELGLDIRFLKGRLGLDISGYLTNTYDQLFTIALPVGSGASSFFTNGGNIQNKGIEALLTTKPIAGKDFKWNVDVNFSLNRNMVLSISDERPRLIISTGFFSETVIEQGKPFGQIYSKGFLRNDKGEVMVGTNGIPQLTPGKTVYVANFNPDWMGGITNSFSYKKMSFSFLLDHRQGGTMLSATDAMFTSEGTSKLSLIGREGGLVFGKDVFSNERAVLPDGSVNTVAVNPETFWNVVGGRNAPAGEAFVQSATNLRVREVVLGFELPKSLLLKAHVAGAKVSIVGRNLFFIYKASPNLDPDLILNTNASSPGSQMFAPPTERTFGLNLKLDF
ncbi:MAG: TonB-dependent receptor plug [Sphingobacteriales bacterium]|nr:TonB-dependent receptor plug [Sphingobacteriales bacterium]